MMITENRQEVFYMLREGMNGFCMALADSVPGVSGGTVAFILGFYDRFIGSINDFVFGNMEKKKESHIYTVSSLFMGFIAGSIPLIIREEKESFGGSRNILKGIGFCIAGILVVAGIAWLNGKTGVASMDLGQFHIGTGIRLFFIGMIAISAMFLPGISGSTLLLIFGAYIPVITAVRGLLGMDFSYLPLLMFFGFGVLTGAVTVVRGIQVCLEKFRTQSVYAILGMMIGSFYAIMQGPATLKVPQPVMGFGNFQILAALVGLALVLGMQLMKERR